MTGSLPLFSQFRTLSPGASSSRAWAVSGAAQPVLLLPSGAQLAGAQAPAVFLCRFARRLVGRGQAGAPGGNRLSERRAGPIVGKAHLSHGAQFSSVVSACHGAGDRGCAP